MKWLVFFFGLRACTTGIQYPDGGYPYPDHVNAKDTNFYYYPYRNALNRKDSFDYGRDCLFFQNFNEPNLSLRGQGEDVFRLTYSGFGTKSFIILLRKNKISIKSGDAAALYEWGKENLLPSERKQLQVLENHFPLDDPQRNSFMQHIVDSMLKTEPRLLDPNYYLMLEKKDHQRNAHPPLDSSTNIPITENTFNEIVSGINASGFWSLPFLIKCDEYPTDGDGFMLEASTKTKYKVVHVHGCSPGDTTRLAKACQKLVEFVHLEKEVRCFSGNHGVGSVVVKDVQLQEIKPERRKKHHRSSSK